MSNRIDRRTFLQAGTAGLVAGTAAWGQVSGPEERPLRFGIIGTGGRGSALMGILLGLKVNVPAVCDLLPERAAAAQEAVVKAGQQRPESYAGSDDAYKQLLKRDDLDAVLIATPWEWHARMAIDAMKAGKYVGVEVPCAITLEECWELVDTQEKTGVPCMMLENWSFRRDNLAVLNMIRKGLFGEIVHCHCAHSHNCIPMWYWDAKGNPRWSAKYLVKYNRDQYPVHSLGPVLSWMDINCGDSFEYLTSTASASVGINAHFARTLGADHPLAKGTYAQGDIVTTVVRTRRGKTLVINNDMQLPRPYDNRWLIQGTLGLYDEERNSVYAHGRSPQNEKWEPFDPYQQEFDHRWWKEMAAAGGDLSHGGADDMELKLFVKAVRERGPLPLDIYDSVTMSCIIPLSQQSIAKRSAPVECPDFTRGKWKTQKPWFAV